jgi:hypothetical protein
MRERKLSVLLLGLTVAIIAFVVVQNASGDDVEIISGDGEVYESVEALAAASDLVVVGRVMETVETYTDSAGDAPVDERGDAIPGLAKEVVSIEVDETLKGSGSQTIHVVTADDSKVISDWEPSLKSGDRVVLYLFAIPGEAPHLSPELSERVAKYGSLFGVVGGTQGVFDVTGDSATSRSGDDEALELEVASK